MKHIMDSYSIQKGKMTLYNSTATTSTLSMINVTLANETTVQMNDSEVTMDQIWAHIEPTIFQWIFLVFFLLIFIIGITGNFLVCYAVWKSNQLKTVTNFFLVNLAAADFLVILLCLPLTVTYETIKSWVFGLAVCKFTIYIQKVSVFVSTVTLTVISMERYLAILHPLTFHGESRRTRLVIAVIWILSILIPLADVFNMTVVHNPQIPVHLRPWLSQCIPEDDQLEKHLFIFYTVTFYFVPLLIMTYAYTKIAICLWSSTSTGNAVAENLQYESAIEQLKTRRRSAKMLIVVVITFGICYLPIYTINIYRYTDAFNNLQDVETARTLFWIARLIQLTNSCINPVIYNFMSVKFRKQFRSACFGCYRCCFRSAYMSDTRTSQYTMRRYVIRDEPDTRLHILLTSKNNHSVVFNRCYLKSYNTH